MAAVTSRRGDTRYWHARRERAAADEGSEVFISLVDLGFNPDAPGEWTLEAETTCLNRDLPHRLNLSEGASAFRLTQGGPIEAIKCLTGRATPTLRVPQKRGGLWRIISHLSLNHWSLTDGEDGADALREILALYDFADSADTRSMIEGLLSVAARRVPGRSRRRHLPRAGGNGPSRRRPFRRPRHLPLRRRAGAFPGALLFAEFVLETDRHHQPKGRRAAAMEAQGGGNSAFVGGAGVPPAQHAAGTAAPLSRQLQEQAHRFEFFQAVRLMHRLADAPSAGRPAASARR